MNRIALFAAGIIVGLAVHAAIAQERKLHGLNHVGIVVADYAAALRFYTETLGLPEAYTIHNSDGSVRLTYLQVNRETFVELIPAAAGQSPGINHFGIEVGDIDAAVADLRTHGVAAGDPGRTPANAEFVRIADRDGVPIEMLELGPESLQRKAINAWK